MSVAAARALKDVDACFVGIGLPSTAANLARRTHAPDLVLVYESGAIGAKPPRLPLSIGDGMLGETADAVVSGARDLQLLGPARPDRRRLPRRRPDRPLRQHQHDRDRRRLRPPEGAPARAPAARRRSPRRCGEVIVIVRQTHARVRREGRLRHVASATATARATASGSACAARARRKVITDLGVLEPDPTTCELVADARCTRA